MEKKQDARVRYTKMMIRSSFIALMKEKSLSHITVTEICERAGINRATFYAHYRDPSDLLDTIEREVMDEISRAALPLVSTTRSSTRDAIAEIFRFVRENADVCTVLLNDGGESVFLERVIAHFESYFISVWTGARNMSPEDARTLFSFAAIGSMGQLRQWLQGGMKRSPEEMADIIMKLIWYGFSAF